MSGQPPHAAHGDWREANARWLALALRALRARLHRHALAAGTGAQRSVDWIVAAEDGELARPVPAAIDARVAALERRRDEQEVAMRTAGRPPAFAELVELADLDELEANVLLLAAAPGLDSAFAAAYGGLQGGAGSTRATLALALSMFVHDVGARVLAQDCLLPSRPLRALRLVEIDGDDTRPFVARGLALDERMTDYLRGVNRVDSRVAPLFAPIGEAPHSAGTLRAGEEAARLIAREADRWVTINLIGDAEKGAREAAQRACALAGLAPQMLDLARLAAHSAAERAALAALVAREAALAGIAVIVDAADVEPGGHAAAVVDELIASLGATVFVVSAERWPARPGVAVVRVAPPSRGEQRALWAAALGEEAQRINGTVDALAQQFDLGPSAIGSIVARARDARGTVAAAELWRVSREHSATALAALAQRIEPCYGWNDIVVGEDVRAQLVELAAQVEQRGRVYEAWGFGAQLDRGRGITALFSGPSGTGKTMAAEILARHLELDLYRIDLAGVVSKYIGETEKNLRRVFDAAQRSGALLFFDEADALFGARTEVRDSHDRYANLEINYLLQRMEDYAGLAILATNRRSALDAAFLRRLRFVIDFPFPGAEHRRRIWERVFPPQAPTENLELALLSKMDLSGGNIKSIAVNAAFLAAAERIPIGMASVARAAAREYAKLGKPVSAAEFGAYYDSVRR
jgi:SpoVK/Ycf46/Vps4 family AAA+-type ATPase